MANKSIFEGVVVPDYEQDVKEQYASVDAEVQRQEDAARRNRNIAILGDMARIWGDAMSARNGGSWMIKERESMAAPANERLEKMKSGKAAMKAQYAKDRATARKQKFETDLALASARAKAKSDADANELAMSKMLLDQANKDRDYQLAVKKADETAAHNKKMQDIYQQRTNAYAGYVGRGGARGKESEVYLINEGGEKEYFSAADYANPLEEAYLEAVTREPSLIPKRTEYEGWNRTPVKVDEQYPSSTTMKHVIARYNEKQRKAQAEAAQARQNDVEEYVPDDEVIDYIPGK